MNGKDSPRVVQNERGKCNPSPPCVALLPHLTVLLSLRELGVSSEMNFPHIKHLRASLRNHKVKLSQLAAPINHSFTNYFLFKIKKKKRPGIIPPYKIKSTLFQSLCCTTWQEDKCRAFVPGKKQNKKNS